MLHITWHNLFINTIPFPTIMKLFVMLLAIYSLIFYQQYKIQRSSASLRESASKIVRALGAPASGDQQDFKTTSLLIGTSDTKTKQPQITKARYYQ
jgi:hypothetical protein